MTAQQRTVTSLWLGLLIAGPAKPAAVNACGLISREAIHIQRFRRNGPEHETNHAGARRGAVRAVLLCAADVHQFD